MHMNTTKGIVKLFHIDFSNKPANPCRHWKWGKLLKISLTFCIKQKV